jgi:hypothetical protein
MDEAFFQKLKNLKSSFKTLIEENFEFKAKSCITCETQGICCTDSHFVNVHITQLEAIAIIEKLKTGGKLDSISPRIEKTISEYHLSENGDTFNQTYSCPLFEKSVGCIIHGDCKPVPCMSHACYEREEDVPPQFLQDRIEAKIENLNVETFGENRWLPLPIWLEKLS